MHGLRRRFGPAIDQAFVLGFRLIMLLCAGLAVASAAVASRMIPSRAVTQVSKFNGVVVAKIQKLKDSIFRREKIDYGEKFGHSAHR
jgi:hypothetical protein